MGSTKADLYATMLEETAKSTAGAAAKVSAEKHFKVIQEGKAHPLWLVGHLANTNNLLINMWCCNGESLLPKHYGKIFAPDFAGGAPITVDPATYPSWDELLEQYKTVAAKCAEGIRTLDDATLAGELRGGAPDQMKQIFGNTEKTLRSIIAHDSYHRGQMALIVALK